MTAGTFNQELLLAVWSCSEGMQSGHTHQHLSALPFKYGLCVCTVYHSIHFGSIGSPQHLCWQYWFSTALMLAVLVLHSTYVGSIGSPQHPFWQYWCSTALMLAVLVLHSTYVSSIGAPQH